MIGSFIGTYRITAKLGAGGMGEVYRVTDTRLDRIRRAVLSLLDILVENGSAAAFRMRDDFVTPVTVELIY